VSKTTSSIEINGNHYDTATGLAVNTGVSTKTGGSLDGVFGKTPTKVPLAAPRTKPVTPITPLSADKIMDMQPPKRPARSAAQNVGSHLPQGSQTLMRHVVQKPGKSLKRRHAAQGPTDALVARPPLSVAPKHSISTVPAGRLARAEQVNQSSQISRFIKPQASPATPTTPTPAAVVTHRAAPVQQPLDVFEIAMQRATSHQQLPVIQHKHPRSRQLFSKRRTSIAATAATVLLLVGLVGLQYRTTIALHLATGKAGFSATIPAYRPAGYSIGKLNATAGSVAINFRSNSDQRAYAITEKPSAWDSATLRDNFVSSADSHFQTVQVGGRTVYLYGKNNAAWVNGGIWYQVQSGGALSDRQLSELAASL
jgi:hypothetical protein